MVVKENKSDINGKRILSYVLHIRSAAQKNVVDMTSSIQFSIKPVCL